MLDEKVKKAREAQKNWELIPVSKRSQWLKNFQKLLVKKSGDVLAAIQSDTKKPSIEALGIEISAVLMTADYYRGHAKKILKPRHIIPHWMFINKCIRVEHAPYGVVGILGPFNLPFSLTIGDAIPALMAGNAVIIKPSEFTPRAAEVGAALAQEAGLPANLLQIFQGGAEAGAELIEKVDTIFFTGSTAVGKKVAARAGELLKPCILELGGKAPMIVLGDADLERAARACVWGRFAHNGQHCIAVERVYVDYKIANAFIERVIFLTRELKPEELSPLHLSKTKSHLAELLQDAIQRGAEVVFQSEKESGPVILTNVNHTMRVMKEEAFGPMLPIMIFSNMQNLIALANDSESGLSAVVFSKNKKIARDLADRIQSGNVSINDCMDHFMILGAPFGGWKNSGLGLRHSREGLLQFTRPKTIFRHAFNFPFLPKKREFWWFPYEAKNEVLLKKLVRFFFS